MLLIQQIKTKRSYGGHEPSVLKRLRGQLTTDNDDILNLKDSVGQDAWITSICLESARLKFFDESDKIMSIPSKSFTKTAEGLVPPAFVEEDPEHQRWIGTKPLKGSILRFISRQYGSARVLELGTNSGFGTCYLSHENNVVRSIEGSFDLHRIASKVVACAPGKVELVHSYFDDEIDNLSNAGDKFDLVFIDGQHEHTATIHYANKCQKLLSGNGALLFDDIFWSPGMHSSFFDYLETVEFAYSAVVDTMGIVVFAGGDSRSLYVDTSDVLSFPRVKRQR
jgi:predicted O-methyltransferase YrrM